MNNKKRYNRTLKKQTQLINIMIVMFLYNAMLRILGSYAFFFEVYARDEIRNTESRQGTEECLC